MYGTQRKTKTELLDGLRTVNIVSSCMPRPNTLDYVDVFNVRRIRLHKTDILTFDSRGGFVVNTGGWNTLTTRDRINHFLPCGYSVYTHNGQIHLSTPTRGVVPFGESVQVGPRGAIKPDQSESAQNRLKRLIDQFMNHVKRNGLPSASESGGDPFVFSPDQVDKSVMVDWLESKYFTRRMYCLAIEYAGLTDFAAVHFCDMIDRKDGKLDATDTRRIRRYIRSRVGLAV